MNFLISNMDAADIRGNEKVGSMGIYKDFEGL
jgi:hypothetical protein